MTIFIKNGNPHRQRTRQEKVLHPDGLLDTQKRLQPVRQINWRQGVKIPDARARTFADPVEVTAAIILWCISIFIDAFMQRFQRGIAFHWHITQTEIGHAEVITAD